MIEPRTCAAHGCAAPIEGKRSDALYCSTRCRAREAASRRRCGLGLADREAMMAGRTCAAPGCGNSLDGKVTKARHCSQGCASAAWAARNPDRAQAIARASHLMRTYGLTPEQFDTMLAAQNHRCAITACGVTVPGGQGTWKVDHDHTTGKVRALLCHSCNVLLGQARDDRALLRGLDEYLERHDGVTA